VGTGTTFSMYDCNQNEITGCPRARILQKPSYQRNGSATATGTPDLFAYITFPTYNSTNYGSDGDPKLGAEDLLIIVASTPSRAETVSSSSPASLSSSW